MIRSLSTALMSMAMVFSIAAPAAAQSPIEITNPHAYPAVEDATTGAAFMTFTYTPTDPADQLILVETPVAGWVEIHTTLIEDNVMQMRPVGILKLPPTGRVDLKPGGVHLMLMGLKQPLKSGDSFPMTLTFEKAGVMTIQVPVKAYGEVDTGAVHDHSDPHGHGH